MRNLLGAGLIGLVEGATKAFQKAGVAPLAGTDTPIPCVVPGFSLHHELEELVHAGLRSYEALRAATANPAVSWAVSSAAPILLAW